LHCITEGQFCHDAEPSCHVFLEFLISGGFDEAGHDDVLWRIASTILLRRDEDQICVRQSNGQSRVYVRQASPRKQIVKKSQKNNRRVAARRHLAAACAVVGSGRNYVAGGGSDFGTVAVGVPGATSLSLREQVGLVFELGVSWSCYKKLRLALGGRKSGLARRHVLRDTKRKIAASPAQEVLVTNTGAHLANLSLAV